ncbi:MAG: Uma2 family endonuclease [Gammaproteobacteria bacterium]
MSRPAATMLWTTEDFLAWEREQPERYEWDGANVIAMTSARLQHNAVIGNLYRAIYAQLPAGCRVFTQNVKLRAGEAIRYPDVVVACQPEFNLNADILEDATAVVEVLSPSTARVDRVAKLANYAHVPSLEAYLIVDPGRRHLELHRREAGQLIPAPAAGVDAELFGSVVISIDDIYTDVL